MTGPASQRAPGSAQAASRIRRKLILLHTLFSLTLSAMIVLAVGASVRPLVAQSEMRECRLALALHDLSPEACAALSGVAVRTGSPSTLGIDEDLAAGARAANGGVVEGHDTSDHAIAVRYDIARNEFHAAMVRSPAARAATTKLYVLLTVSLLAVYALIALTLEVFVLPKQVYSPIERLRRAVVEASKQCGRNRLMAIGDPCSFDAFLAEASGTRVRLLAHPATTSETMLRANSPGEDEDVAVIIGPEGGFTDEEVARSQEHEWRTISLGPRVLRTETAAVAIAAVFAVPSSVSR